MSIMTPLRRILNKTPGTATNIDYNFVVLEDYVNTSVVTTDGANAVTGAPLVVPAPVADDHAATKGYVDGLWFTGMIMEFGGDALPVSMVNEWEFCNGGVRSSTDPKYQPLFNVIGTKYGAGGGGANFNLPDFRGKVAVGKSDLGTDVIFDTLGKSGGKRDSELLIHQHTVPIHKHTASSANESPTHTHGWSGSLSLTMTGAGTHGHGLNSGAGVTVWYNSPNPGSGFTNIGGGMNLSGAWIDYGPQAGDHTHGMAGSSVSGSVTGGAHSHGVTVDDKPAFDTTGSAAAGTTLTDKNMPPWLVVNRIIKL